MRKHLFSADGIRGFVDQHPLTPQGMELFGRAVAAWLHGRAVQRPPCLLGSDTRESSRRLKLALANGLTRGGIPVVDAVILPTPALSYLLANKGFFAAGIMVSASHNAVDENGVKVFDERGLKLDDASENQIESLLASESRLPFEIRPASISQEPAFAEYYARMLAREYQGLPWRQVRVVAVLANGAAYRTGQLILDQLQLPYMLLNASPDGTNINVAAGSEAVRRNPGQLASLVAEYDAVAGFTLDGDADRMLLVDRRARVYDGDMALAILAPRLKQENMLRHDTAVATRLSNSGLGQYLAVHGIRTHLVRNGDKYITSALLDQDLALGGEEIGHIILHTDVQRVTGDGIRAVLRILALLASEPGTELGDLAPGMRKWPQVRVSVWLGCRTEVQTASIPGLDDLLAQVQA
jgi:phosphoglucosamine mutase